MPEPQMPPSFKPLSPGETGLPGSFKPIVIDPNQPVQVPTNFAIVNGEVVPLEDTLKGRFDKFALERTNQLSGQEPGVLNPQPEQNPLMFGSFLPEAQHPADEGYGMAALRGIWNQIARPLASPGGIIGTFLDANPPTEPIPNPASIMDRLGGAVSSEADNIIPGRLAQSPLSEMRNAPAQASYPKLGDILSDVKADNQVMSDFGKPRMLGDFGKPRMLGKSLQNLSDEDLLKSRGVSSVDDLLKYITPLDEIFKNPGRLAKLDIADRAIFDSVKEDYVKSKAVLDEIARRTAARKVHPIDQLARGTTPESNKPLIEQVPEINEPSRWQKFLWDETGSMFIGGRKVSTARAKLLQAIEDAKPVREAQEKSYTLERGQRMGRAEQAVGEGEDWAKNFMKEFKGEYRKVAYEPIDLPPADKQALFDELRYTARLTNWERPRAITGMFKLFDGEVPQDNELQALSRVFSKRKSPQPVSGPQGSVLGRLYGNEKGALQLNLPFDDDFVNTIIGKKGPTRISVTKELLNLPRTLQASVDFSAPFRQGAGLITHKAWWGAWKPMFKAAASKEGFEAVMEDIRKSPHFSLGQEAGLHISDPRFFSSREERFFSRWAQKVPGVKGSENAYTAFLNKARQDLFETLVKDAREAYGVNPATDLPYARALADFVNTASGRGNLHSLESSAEALNTVFYSPRFVASRLQLPMKLADVAHPQIRKEAFRALLGMGAIGGTMLSLGTVAGGKVETDPTSADFMKVRMGNARLDPWGGMQQYVVLANQIAWMVKTSSVTGKASRMNAGYGSPTQTDTFIKFWMNKMNPPLAYPLKYGMRTPKQPFDIPAETLKLLIPMWTSDMYDILKDNPDLAPEVFLADMVGMGAQDYQTFKP